MSELGGPSEKPREPTSNMQLLSELRCRSLAAFLLIASLAIPARSQVTEADYARAARFQADSYQELVRNLYVAPNWFDGGLWYELETDAGSRYLRVDDGASVAAPLFDHQRLAERLSAELQEPADPDDLPVEGLRFASGDSLFFRSGDQHFVITLSDYALSRSEPTPNDARQNEATSPDGSTTAIKRGYNLYLRDASGRERRLSHDGRQGYEYGTWYGWGDIIRGEGTARPDRFYVDWSADSRYFATQVVDLRSARKMYLLDWTEESTYRPELLGYYRGSPGDTAMVYNLPRVYEAASGREIKPQLPRSTHINSSNLIWSRDGHRLFAVTPERGYKKRFFHEIDLETGAANHLWTDSSSTMVDSSPFDFRVLSDGGGIVLTSETSGWNHLYFLNTATAEIRPLTRGPFVVGDIEHLDEAGGRVYFTASGRETGENPYWQKGYSVGLDGRDLTLLTPETGHHQLEFSDDGRQFVDNYSSAAQPTVTVLRSSETGEVVLELGRADIEGLLALGWDYPETFETTAGDGRTTIHGAIWKPTNFDPANSYPVIDLSYTGPHTFQFPRTFGRASWSYPMVFAEMGFVTVMVDGRGTAGRSKAFRDWSYKRMGYNLEDHVVAIRELGRRHPWIDTTRVGITGHSAGGYDAAHALLQYPDFYSVAVSSSADHDHRMEKAWWPEMYMGWPVDEAYHEQSNVTMASNLRGKLLITHGGIDENVNPSATFRLAEELIKADKSFDLFIFPSQRHGYRGAAGRYFQKLRLNYFVEHLLGAEPLWDIDWPD